MICPCPLEAQLLADGIRHMPRNFLPAIADKPAYLEENAERMGRFENNLRHRMTSYGMDGFGKKKEV